jgi:hypothetical protein
VEGKAGLSRSELRPPVCSFVGCRVSNAEVSSVSGKTWTAHIILPSTLMHPRPRPAIIFLRASVRLGRTAGRCRSYAPSSPPPLPAYPTASFTSLHFTSREKSIPISISVRSDVRCRRCHQMLLLDVCLLAQARIHFPPHPVLHVHFATATATAAVRCWKG